MDFELSSSAEADVLVVTFGGRVGEDNVIAMVRRYFDLVRAERPKKVLADVRTLEGQLSSGRINFLVRNLPQPVPKAVKTAFVDRDAALAWLRSS